VTQNERQALIFENPGLILGSGPKGQGPKNALTLEQPPLAPLA
jgi:hypothetical protein